MYFSTKRRKDSQASKFSLRICAGKCIQAIFLFLVRNFEGDLLLDESQRLAIFASYKNFERLSGSLRRRRAVVNESMLFRKWPQARVPYRIDRRISKSTRLI